MQTVTVLVIADGPEATVICAALAKHPDVRAIDARDAYHAIKLWETQGAPPALAIGDTAALAKSKDELVRILQARGIPLIGIAAGLSQKAKQRALAAGVEEIHDRPRDWHAYSELIEAVLLRFGHKS
jgi:CheY-like chemotaxis protein